MRISDWSSDVCSSDLILVSRPQPQQGPCRNLLGGNRIDQQAFHARWFNARGLPEGNCRVVRGRISVPGRDGTGAWDRLGTTALVWEAVVFHFRHPGLDPGSTAALRPWTPDQVRGDDDGKNLPAAKRRGGGPSPQAK